MSATVLGCGHTSHLRLFEIDIVVRSPQVHLHFWTSKSEYDELGYAKVELCCHGCGAAELIYYLDEEANDRHLKLRDEFALRHARCPNRNYQSMCPDWRSSFKVIDIRHRKPLKYTQAETTPISPFRNRRSAGRSMLVTKPATRVKTKEDS